ncbi:MAG: PaREP1 family protein [Thaumarchaeota archaeon]|jgi:hypothetical protein|nr:PaREP1 family protein [Candidatus Geocrenenecus arthurdayi]MCL7391079.1 PaREP1 family protein [Candidatus Geocrenenecus arthurdayi]MCL7396915.1 PaREP1 family protein [Candidatus Geocrenenecus arthurdayi]MCL7403455.1 PaREP1 family protein [Candidatus Geocrenenecus arthurdayi]
MCKSSHSIFQLNRYLIKSRGEGGWTVADLEKAMLRISERIGEWFHDAWDHAWTLHVWGFHEGKFDYEDVEVRLPHVEKIIREAFKIIRREDLLSAYR